MLERGIGGVYHAVSEKYLQSYINEYGLRYNHRKDGFGEDLGLAIRLQTFFKAEWKSRFVVDRSLISVSFTLGIILIH